MKGGILMKLITINH